MNHVTAHIAAKNATLVPADSDSPFMERGRTMHVFHFFEPAIAICVLANFIKLRFKKYCMLHFNVLIILIFVILFFRLFIQVDNNPYYNMLFLKIYFVHKCFFDT